MSSSRPNQVERKNNGVWLQAAHDRIIRLCGSESDTTELSTERYGRHILPVLESANSRTMKDMVDTLTSGGVSPGVWRGEDGNYGLNLTPPVCALVGVVFLDVAFNLTSL